MAAFVRKFVDKRIEEQEGAGGLPVPDSFMSTLSSNVILTIDIDSDIDFVYDNDASYQFTTVNP